MAPVQAADAAALAEAKPAPALPGDSAASDLAPAASTQQALVLPGESAASAAAAAAAVAATRAGADDAGTAGDASSEAGIRAAVEAALATWQAPEPAARWEELLQRWPGLLLQDLWGDVLPRIAQLGYLVEEGKLTAEACVALVVEQPRVLGHYVVRSIWQRDDLVAVNKPYDMRIDLPKGEEHRWPRERTLADWFADAYPGQRVRFCHQLDHATSGVMLMATTKASGRIGSQLFEKRRCQKTYWALVLGRPPWAVGEEVRLTERFADGEGFARRVVVDPDEPGEEAETRVRVLRVGRWPASGSQRTVDAALVEAKPVTGRRHQIRLHLSFAGIPILGDDTYGGQPFGGAEDNYRMYLHAMRLELPLPTGDAVIEAPCNFGEELSSEAETGSV
eukprot:TRINITY_DN20691_c0_g1_i1.p1 TRINITY_DN20691_c0_g1~~TRINITY_DN20691_c0_g1_i1.p1  ORF type:complete len:408 (+),score=99.73 TRINITY_DN20691_c0_g1_i1:48-1226(+)